ncbi:glycosyltransferase [Sphingomonas oryzagri]
MIAELSVCVPARNEAERITTLISALGDQDIDGPIRLALCVNNSDDDSAGRARDAADKTRGRVILTIEETEFPDALAHAGSARRAAMELGRRLLGHDAAYLLTTDADCRPPTTWISANLAAAGPDRIVGGRIEIDQADPDCEPGLLALRKRFDLYWEHVRAIEDAIDPSEWDVAPRHGDHTGASLLLSVGLYRRAGGVPAIPTGEDRALVEAAIQAGGRLVHPASVWTRTSPRRVGRAKGGMAADMAAWAAAHGAQTTPLVPAFQHWRDRAHWRRSLRGAGSTDVALAERALPPMPCDMPLPGGWMS